jgi:hypothetical protein
MAIKTYREQLWTWLLPAVFAAVAAYADAETLCVNSSRGNNASPGTREKPLQTIRQAAVIVNSKTGPGPTVVKIAPGIYNLTECVVFDNNRPYTGQDRLVIEATILPDDPNWKPALMPVILSTEDPRKLEDLNKRTETYSLKIKTSHVTVRGLKFLGNPLLNNWHCCVERVGKDLNDLVVTQCMFLGDKDAFNVYCAALATGDRFVVDHCIFYNCGASAVFWDGPEGVPGKNCAMRFCIVDGAYLSGAWTCQTKDDFEFHNNVVTRSEYFWMRKSGDSMKYRLRDCVVTNNKHYSGYGIESGPTGQTGPEVSFEENAVVKQGEVILERDKNSRNYLHVVEGGLGSGLGAGLFRK